MGNLSKFNILTNEVLSGIDASKHPNELFGTIDDPEEKVVVDSEMSPDSENPVQNKVLYNPVTFAESERKKSETDGAIVHENNENLEFAKCKRINTTNLWDNSQLESTTSCIPSATGFKLINTTNYDVHTNKCKINLKANTTYTISCRRIASTTNNGFIYCKWFGVDGSTLWENNIESEKVLFTPSVEIVAVDFYIKHDQPLNSYVEIEELQINEGAIAKPFEQFKGGALVQTKDLYNYVNNDKLKLVNIFAADVGVNWEYSLSRPITDFTFICIRVKWGTSGSSFLTIPTTACLNYNTVNARMVASTDAAFFGFYFPSTTTWYSADSYANGAFVQIYGIL